MPSFALFRLPYEQRATLFMQHIGEPLALSSFVQLSDVEGFVVAPFAPSASSPILVIRPDVVTQVDLTVADPMQQVQPLVALMEGERIEPLDVGAATAADGGRGDYHIDFLNFHAQLERGDYQKLVLSRSIDIPRRDVESSDGQGGAAVVRHALQLYFSACQRYPRVMVGLVYTAQSGLWLTASPEILLSGVGSQWQTVALAGTMPYAEQIGWSDKNIQEQRYVATYIAEQLEQFTADFTEQGPRTVRAAHLAHLRSDFRFSLSDASCIGALLQALHPTPAVCGLPKQQAFQFIQQNEHHRRRYYSGFMGPLSAGATHLYVSLRCMQLFADGYRLYAGGGLLTDSREQLEWQETEAKLDTMRNLIDER